MTNDNSVQITEWNGPQGQRWVEEQAEIDVIARPFGLVALEQAAPQLGERVIDVGCGCGGTTFELARRVGAAGHVLGVDVSRPMLAAAQARLSQSPGAPIAFKEGDASAVELPTGCDLMYSRFGMMFFADPAAALRHLRGALRDGGRLVFVCWRQPRDNPWAVTPMMAARRALGLEPPPADPHAPGPFAFADDQRLAGLLTQAGFADVALRRFDAPLLLGTSPADATAKMLRIGPAARLAGEADPDQRLLVAQAVQAALEPLAAADGSVTLAGSTWVVSAIGRCA